MSTDTHIAIGEMRMDPRSKLFPRALKAKFTIEQKRALALGKSITITASELKGSSRGKKNLPWNVIFLTNEQYAVAQERMKDGKTFKLKFSPLQREFNARYSSGLFGDIWSGIKSAAKTVYSGAKKVVNSDIGKAVLRGVDTAAFVLSEGQIPAGLVSGVTGAVFADDPEPQPEVDYGDVPEEDYAPLPAVHPRTGQEYSFPAPPTKPRKGGAVHNSQSVILSQPLRPLKYGMAKRGEGVIMPRVVGSGAPRIIQTSRGRRFHNGQKFISEAEYHQMAGSGLNIPSVRAY